MWRSGQARKDRTRAVDGSGRNRPKRKRKRKSAGASTARSTSRPNAKIAYGFSDHSRNRDPGAAGRESGVDPVSADQTERDSNIAKERRTAARIHLWRHGPTAKTATTQSNLNDPRT